MTVELTAATDRGTQPPAPDPAVITSDITPELIAPEPPGSDWAGSGLAGVSTPGLADLVAEHTMAVRRTDAVVLGLACEWADRHPVLHPKARLSRSREAEAVRWGQ